MPYEHHYDSIKFFAIRYRLIIITITPGSLTMDFLESIVFKIRFLARQITLRVSAVNTKTSVFHDYPLQKTKSSLTSSPLCIYR